MSIGNLNSAEKEQGREKKKLFSKGKGWTRERLEGQETRQTLFYGRQKKEDVNMNTGNKSAMEMVKRGREMDID